MLQKKTVEKKTFELLKALMDEPLLQDTRLVGGTSLALQIGHRISTDLDFFTDNPIEIDKTIKLLQDKYVFDTQLIADNTIIGIIDGIKIDIIQHPYKWLEKCRVEGNIKLADIKDISAMKLHAIANSGKRPKDFVDIAFLSQYFSYNNMKEFATAKYPFYDPIIFDRAIIYFDDINKNLITNIKTVKYKMDWAKIKNRIIRMTDNPDKIFNNPPLNTNLQNIKR